MSNSSRGVASESPASSAELVRRMMALVWKHRWECVRILLLQVVLLTMGLLGLGLMGLGVDYLRYEVATTTAADPSPAIADMHVAGDADTTTAAIKPPRWPFGLEPPDDWPPMKVVAAIAAAILLFSACRAVLNVVYTLAVNQLVQARIVVDLRAKVYDKMQRLSFRFFDANASGSIINRVTTDVQALRSFVDSVFLQGVILAISFVVYLIYMLRVHVWLTLACLATTPFLWYVTVYYSRIMRPGYARQKELFDEQTLAVSENVRGVHVVKGFGHQSLEEAKFTDIVHRVRDQKHWIYDKITTFRPLLGLLTHMNLVVMIAYGGYLVVCYDKASDLEAAASVGLSVGQLLVFAGLLQQFSGQVAHIGDITDSLQQSLAGAQRVFEVLDTPVEICSAPDAVRIPHVKGDVCFENVTFGYKPEVTALEDIDLSVEPGQCVAVLGATGAGKTTLLSLIPRFYEPSAGRVLIDGQDIRSLDLDDLRSSVGIVFQESFLFSNTVKANIAFGHPGATQEQIELAARTAAAHEFITDMPRSYDTVLHEGGANLSGGQRQRLAIARALLLEPAILLLDDPTAAIDPQTEEEILSAIESAIAGRTTFLVAHRLSTLRRADLVIVLEKGRIIQAGTHDDLMQVQGHYRGAARLQLADPESLRLLGVEEGNCE